MPRGFLGGRFHEEKPTSQRNMRWVYRREGRLQFLVAFKPLRKSPISLLCGRLASKDVTHWSFDRGELARRGALGVEG